MKPEREALVIRYERLARSIARQIWPRAGMWREDIESAALCGLVQAAQSWNGEGNFPGWASFRIKGAVWDEIRNLKRSRATVADSSFPVDPHALVIHDVPADDGAIEKYVDEDRVRSLISLVSDTPLVRTCHHRRTRRWLAEQVFIAGREQKELAALMGVTPSRVSQYVRHVKNELRDILQREAALA